MQSGMPTLWTQGEGNTTVGAFASRTLVPRSRRPRARRETASTRTGRPHRWLNGNGSVRPEKACSRTSGMNGGEESDRAIVPMKSPNKAKEQQARAAEVVEERARTKENTGEVRTSPTQSGQGVSQSLTGVRTSGNALPPSIRGRSCMR